jgi:hypothetical protein
VPLAAIFFFGLGILVIPVIETHLHFPGTWLVLSARLCWGVPYRCILAARGYIQILGDEFVGGIQYGTK